MSSHTSEVPASTANVECPSDVEGLVAALGVYGGRLVVADPPGVERAAWRRVIWRAINLGGLPDGLHLRHTGRNRGDLIIWWTDETPEPPKPKAPEVKVPKTVPRTPHPAVVVTRSRVTTGADDLVRAYPTQGTIAVRVTRPLLSRVWRVAHALFTEAERRGYTIQPDSNSRGRHLAVVIDGQVCDLAFVEGMHQVERPPTAWEAKNQTEWSRSRPFYDLRPSGVLRVRHGVHRGGVLASDGKQVRVEDRVGRILHRLEESAADQRRRAEEAARHAQLRLQRELEALEARKVQERDRRRVQHLEDLARRWRTAQNMREFLAEVRRHGPGVADPEWLAWAEAQVKVIDPRHQPALLRHPDGASAS